MGAFAVFAAVAAFVSAGDGIVRMERFENPSGVYTTTNRVGSTVFQMDSEFPDTPGVGLHFLEPGDMKTLRVRIPEWVEFGKTGSVRLNGTYLDEPPDAEGFVNIRHDWEVGDFVILSFRNDARRVDVGKGMVELRRGDVVYVAEGDSLADDVTFVVRIEKVGGVRWQVLDASDGRVFTPQAMGRAGVSRFRRLAAKPKPEQKLETAELQRRIDAAAIAGGGRVTIGPGVHKSGTIYLKSGVDLHLEKGAVLLASDNLDDYNALDAFPQNAGIFGGEGWQAKHLIVCLEQENVSISGEGTIDGNGRAFFEDSAFQTIGAATWRDGGINSRDCRHSARPGQLVEFCESKNVRVEGVTFVDPPAWTLFFHGCENVTAVNLRVAGDTRHMNTDGIDIDACRHVRVSHCDIRTGDDAIAIRGAPARLKDKTHVCEDIIVEDIVAKVSASGCRIGVGYGVIRNVRLSNIRVEGAGVGLHVHSAYNRIGGAEISDITLSRVSLLDTSIAVIIVGSNGKRPHDVRFEDVLIERTDYVPGEMVRVTNADNVSLDGIRYLGGCSRAVPYGDDLRDRCWMFGHDSGQFDYPGNETKIPVSPKVTMGEACRYMGLSNVVVCVWHYPAADYLKQFKDLKRVVWAVDNGWVKRHVPGDEYPKRFAAAIERTGLMDNLTGFEFDDFFNGHAKTGCRTDYLEDGTAVKTLTGARTLAELREASRRMHALSPDLDMRLVLYTEELGYGEALKPVIDCFDTVSLWTWHGANLGELSARFRDYRKLVGPDKKTFLGLYMWDFPGKKPVGVENMKRQLDVALSLFRGGQVDGFLFHCTPLVNKNLPEVEMAREWIRAHGDECCKR